MQYLLHSLNFGTPWWPPLCFCARTWCYTFLFRNHWCLYPIAPLYIFVPHFCIFKESPICKGKVFFSLCWVSTTFILWVEYGSICFLWDCIHNKFCFNLQGKIRCIYCSYLIPFAYGGKGKVKCRTSWYLYYPLEKFFKVAKCSLNF